MPIPCYLALTGAEFAKITPLPPKSAWMACHFSCYGTGLSNLPGALPDDAMVIVNDRTPVCGHDPHLIAQQLLSLHQKLQVGSFLLDFQRGGDPLTQQIAAVVTEALPCPVAVSEAYAAGLACPVFLSMPPPYISLQTHAQPWQGRPIWLELALETAQLTVTAAGCQVQPLAQTPALAPVYADEKLCCKYHTALQDDAAVFTVFRDVSSLDGVLLQAQQLDIRRCVGLYQQLGEAAKE